ncbi:MAG: patatin-like phospholipase family protein [Gemmatimonadales bacterium]
MTAPRVVVVLGGGGAKTAAHLGVARALREAGVVPVRWIGTSMGAVMAAALAGGEEPESILARVVRVARSDILRTDWPQVAKGIWGLAIFRSGPIRRTIERIVPARSFAELATPCTVTAVDIVSGSEVAFGAGGADAPLIDALAAACALPPYFRPVRIGQRRCYDGGIRSPVPIHLAAEIDCNYIVAVHTAPGFDETGPPVEVPPPLVAAAETAIGWLMAGTVELQRQSWDLTPGRPPLIWLRPVTDRAATFAADRTAAYAEAGYHATMQVLEEMK